MSISSLSLRDLEYLVTVGRLEHFGRAAEACHVSQPALSAQIKKVEDFLGVALFERTNRKVAITEVGRAVIAQAQVVLEEAQKIVALAKKPDAPLTGELKLGAIATFGPYFAPHLLAPLKQAFPKLELILREGLTDQLLERLRSGELDAVLAARTFDETGLRVMPLFREPFLLAAPKGHPLSAKSGLAASDLRAAEMVLLEDGHCLKDQTLEVCPAGKRGNPRQYHVTSLETLRHLVASGLGYTLMPWLAAGNDERLEGLLKYRKFDDKRIGRDIVLVCRERFPRASDVAALGEFIKKKIRPSVPGLLPLP